MPDETQLTPDQARARFGELTVGPARTHQHFETPEGIWRPDFGPGLVMTGYRLHPLPLKTPSRPQYRPKR